MCLVRPVLLYFNMHVLKVFYEQMNEWMNEKFAYQAYRVNAKVTSLQKRNKIHVGLHMFAGGPPSLDRQSRQWKWSTNNKTTVPTPSRAIYGILHCVSKKFRIFFISQGSVATLLRWGG